MAKLRKQYSRGVFINCPFDAGFQPILRAMVFAVLRCGLHPRSALEIDDSSDYRLHKIFVIIRECRYGIHDLSRTELDGGWPRFNMPLELGIFLGAKHFGGSDHDKKRCLILEREQHSYNRFISDIKGFDIRAHGNKPRTAVEKVRNWLATESGLLLPGGAALWKEYGDFKRWLPKRSREVGLRVPDLTWLDHWSLVQEWIDGHAAKS